MLAQADCRPMVVASLAVHAAVADAPMSGDGLVAHAAHELAIEFTNRRKWRAQRDVLHTGMTSCGGVCRLVWGDNYQRTKVIK
jgi:hypothetical protein